MTQRDEAERLVEYDEQLSAICRQVPKYAPVLRSMAAEIERLKDELKNSEAAVIKKLAGVIVYDMEPDHIIHITDSETEDCFTLTQLKTALAAARVQENERLAKHFDAKPGCEMFGGAIADEIRALIGGDHG